MISKPVSNFFMLFIVILSIISTVSCAARMSRSTPTVTPTSTATTSPTEISIPTVTLTPSPIAINTLTNQEHLDALDETSRIILHQSANEVISFFLEIQDSVRTDNKEKLASLIYYPITIYSFDGKNDKEIQNAAEFIANYEKIVTPEWKEIILDQEPARLLVNWQGVRVTRGELWFAAFCLDESCQDTKLYIITINHTDW